MTELGVSHRSLVGERLHEPFQYVQSTNPGAVGAGKYWLDTSSDPYVLKRRNPSNSSWIIVGSAGGSSYTTVKTVWSPDATPSSPGSEDDEFIDGSGGVPGGWTEVDPNTTLSVNESSSYNNLIMSGITRTGFNPTGIYKTIPAGNFTIWTKVSVRASRSTSYFTAGIGYWEDPTDNTKDIHLWGISPRSGGSNIVLLYYDSSTNLNGSPIALGDGQYVPNSIYLRIRRSGTDYFHGWSTDGLSWIEGSSSNPLFTPTKFGLLVDNASSGITQEASFSFFRYVASDVGLTGVVSGNKIKLLF